jgi:hypothetical protein
LNLQTTLRAERAVDPVAGVARAALSRRSLRADCPTYLAALDHALALDPPPFGSEKYADLYREASTDGKWLAISLMTNAEREGDGAKRLWSLAACATNAEERDLLQHHAVDESGHALAYLALLDLVFPGAVSPEFRSELGTLSPRFSLKQAPVAIEGSPYARTPSIDDYMQMNIAEIRTAIHHTMQRPALEQHCPSDSLPRVTRILDSILGDELNHVGYTAELIERKAPDIDPSAFQSLFCKRLGDFNRITRDELGRMVFD